MSGHGPVGRTKDAGWQIGVSRTVDHPVEEVWDLLTSPSGTQLWLGDEVRIEAPPGTAYETTDGSRGEIRSFRPYEKVRVTWQRPDSDHETTVQIAVSAQGPNRARITLHQERMTSAAERERQRSHWRMTMDRIVAALENEAPGQRPDRHAH
jgi:uncharacterized protein YndB with AHSA1/START domain